MVDNKNEIIKVCLLAGKVMLQSGAETYRVEDTMVRIAASFGIDNPQSYVTPTGIIFSISETESTKFVRILERSTDLHKVTEVNSISRRISSKELSLEEASRLLKEVDQLKHVYPTYIQILAASIVSGCFTIMFQGGWVDFIPSVIVGGVGFSAMVYFHKIVEIRFFAEFLASIFIGLLAYLFIDIRFGLELDKIIIGAVMPLVPGLLITNAVRDLMAGHLVSGLSKGAEAFLTAFAIGAGIAVVFAFI
ncbi:threonine/serine exporter family protein [Aquibacillus koreensis]|uniref:Threonine/serine exporter family protein n=1 Tax=Aquibacillus koreensis TaxID=279446 RepID=A0A9X3WLX1_9BACI|nr:threonine/serine exporter family protein [Aquibacillus koreensis]MCT2537738.1 threonine/serine exporter family protein [Aquibacillus koreensis]MDC3421228.1 threonine/serine exporter family protein [Aquibacillus koreensis]